MKSVTPEKCEIGTLSRGPGPARVLRKQAPLRDAPAKSPVQQNYRLIGIAPDAVAQLQPGSRLSTPSAGPARLLAGFSVYRFRSETQMQAWFLFAILAFLVFGAPLIDELYKWWLRRNAKKAVVR